MLENHTICDFSVFDQSFELFNYLGHRDKQVIRQCIQNFSTVIGIIRARSLSPRTLETGSGFSIVIFSRLLRSDSESIKTIDAFAYDAIQINSRGTSVDFKISDMYNCEIIKGMTIDYEELKIFYDSRNSSLISLSHDTV